MRTITEKRNTSAFSSSQEAVESFRKNIIQTHPYYSFHPQGLCSKTTGCVKSKTTEKTLSDPMRCKL